MTKSYEISEIATTERKNKEITTVKLLQQIRRVQLKQLMPQVDLELSSKEQ